tara:strand:+ start:10784 stop:13894 length:3111 start_codon:yes stop_codon:yes gene_type:complete
MPPVIPAALSAAAAYFAGAEAIHVFAIFALTLTASYMMPQPEAPDFTSESTDRTQVIRSAVAARRFIYGEMVSSGPLVFAASTEENKYLHLVIPLAGHECEAIKSVFLSDQEVTEAMVDGSGNVTSGRYSGKLRIKKHLGASDQAADTDLVSEVDNWTTEHRLRSVTYIYIRLEFDRDIYPTGIPKIKAVVRGKKIYDTRDSQTRWTRNPALIIRDYLLSSDGIGCSSDEVDDTTVTAAANIADEYVTVTALADTFILGQDSTVFSAEQINVEVDEVDEQIVTDTIILENDTFSYQTGDAVELSTTGGLPTGVSTSTTYYIIRESSTRHKLATSAVNATAGTAIDLTSVGTGAHTIVKIGVRFFNRSDSKKQFELGDRVQLTTTGSLPSGVSTSTNYYVVPVTPTGADFYLATSLANAYAATTISISVTGSGTHTVTKNAQLRYLADGSRKLDAKPIDVMEHLLSSLAGHVIYTAGKYNVFAGAATAYSASFDEDILTGSIAVQPKFSRRQLFNQVRGTHTSPYTFWQDSDFPRVTNATYITEDGETITRDIALPWTTQVTRAQRLAKIALEESRQSIVVRMPCNLAVLDVSVHDVIRLTNTKFGWTNKEFRVQQMQITLTGVEMTLQEYASTVWDWNSGEETEIDAAPDTNLPSAYSVTAPAGLVVTEELYTTRNSAGVKTRAIFSWATSGNADVIAYEVRFKEASAAAYKTVGTMGEGTTEISDLKPTTYNFEVRAINALGVRSGFTQLTKEITGLLAPPAALTNLSAQSNGGMVLLSWTQSPDLDVRQGGKIRFRHAPAQTGETWATSQEIGFAIPGAASEVTLPLKAGTYFARPYDSSGVTAASATSVAHDGSSILAYTTSGTASEHTAFAGVKSDVFVDSNLLSLGGEDLLDTMPDFDLIKDFDAAGGVADTGTYTFANAISFGAVTRCRLVSNVKSAISNIRDTIDARTASVDDWDDIDNADTSADLDCQLYFRSTQDDPASGGATWTGYTKFQATESKARGFQFQAILSSDSDDYNIAVSELSVTAETI